MENKTLQVRISDRLLDAIKKKAKEDGSTPSKYVRGLLYYFFLGDGKK